ncbi:permease-like cell division protein FtsX [Sphaerimonospora mesophila]|uniref:permease-like cell division protein FtsX n=1 Tax=Sphaerimonospora mesophila TaxID=37483 RepID=UPI00128ECB16
MAATEEQRHDVERLLANMPEIGEYRRMTPEEALAIARQDFSVGYALTAGMMSGTYGGTLARGDWRRALRQMLGVPGVAAMESFRDDFWWGKSDISIRLCPESAAFSGNCEVRGRASEEEKQIVLDRIRALPGVGTIYFEDAKHALVVVRHAQWLDSRRYADSSRMSEAFHVKFTGTWDFSRIEKTFTELPGVAKVVRDASPWRATMSQDERGDQADHGAG